MASSQSSIYHYPFAASPDIIRANQKDAYFQGVLLEQFTSIIRKLYGARLAHTYTSEAKMFAELFYMSLTTLVGNRTLGEEYCDIMQVEAESLKLPVMRRRAGYILSSILLPYGVERILPKFRRMLRARLEANLHRAAVRNIKAGKLPTTRSRLESVQAYILSNLDTLTSTSPLMAVSLAIFYFSGAYYHLGKRLFRLRYIFTRQVEPSEQRVGYEVLGVLLVLQLAVQAWLHVQSTVAGRLSEAVNPEAAIGGTALLGRGVGVSLDPNVHSSNNALLFESGTSNPQSQSSVARLTNTEVLPDDTYRVHLVNKDALCWIAGRQQRKCTLCLEELKEPSVTTCGHVFCWGCIGDWLRESPQCPLCRQGAMVQHVLPLRA